MRPHYRSPGVIECRPASKNERRLSRIKKGPCGPVEACTQEIIVAVAGISLAWRSRLRRTALQENNSRSDGKNALIMR